MDIARPSEFKGPLIIAAATIVVLGAVLILSMFQTLERQRVLVRQHLHLSARSVHHAIFTSMRPPREDDSENAAPFRLDALDYLSDLGSSGAVLFVGIFDDQGAVYFHSAGNVDADEPRLPPEVVNSSMPGGERAGVQTLGGVQTYVYARRLPTIPPHEDEDEGEDHGAPPRHWNPFEGTQGDVYLMVGLDMTEHLALYSDFRRNALMQSMFTVGAVMAIGLLCLGLMKRMGVSRRAASLERFQSTLLDNLPDGLLTLDSRDLIVSANPAAHRILKVEPGTLAGGGLEHLPKEVAELLPLEGSGGAWNQVEFAGLRLEVLSLPLLRSGPQGGDERLVLVRDRTEIMDLEEHLGEARRLAAVGTLAAGVAHEIRNPLSALRGFAQFFSKKLAGREPEEQYAKTMVREADRLDRVVTDLLFLARPRKVKPDVVNLAEVVQDVERLLARDLESRGVTLSGGLDAAVVQADKDALKQALINLVLNAIDALGRSEGGEPRIEIASSMAGSEKGVWVSVTDNGPGMSSEEKAQAFEPFFTSRHEGTGLGLSIVYTIMREHGGRAVIDSTPGKGASIRLFFPARPEVEDSEKDSGAVQPQGGEP